MRKIIPKTTVSMMLAKPTVEVEVKYKNRPRFQKLLKDLKSNKADAIMMPRVADLSRNPDDVKEACEEIKKMKKSVRFIMDELTGEDVMKMSYDELLKITTATLKDDIVIIVDTPEAAMELANESNDRYQQTRE